MRRAAALLPEIEDLLHRGIACGAFADPWNILGFQGLFPLSPAREDSMRDPRLDELVQVVEQIFNLYARLSGEAAAAGDEALVRSLTEGMGRLAAWWDPFATAEVSDVRRVHGGEAAASARQVAAALSGWRQRGEAAADLALLARPARPFPLPQGVCPGGGRPAAQGRFPRRPGAAGQLARAGRAGPPGRRRLLVPRPGAALDAGGCPARRRRGRGSPSPEERRALVVKFFDYLEANAEDYWEVPTLDLVEAGEEEEEEEEDLYGAAYEDVTYQDAPTTPRARFPTAAPRRTSSTWNARANGWSGGCIS